MSSVAYAEWTMVTKNVNGNTFYVDLDRIRKHDGKVYFWHLLDYSKPTKTGVLSSKVYLEAECGRFRFRILNDTYYNGPMASGTVNSSNYTPDENWIYPPPNSPFEDVLKTACNHKTMQ